MSRTVAMDIVTNEEKPLGVIERNTPVSPITIPRRPHMPDETVAFLGEKLGGSRCYLEYGAGGSTRMAVLARVPHVFSVESDPDFARAVRRAVSHDVRNTFVKVRTTNIGPTKEWGYPQSNDSVGLWPEYPLGIWRYIEAEGVTPDLVLIDGRFRVACFLASLLQTKPGAIILFDDYLGREKRYDSIEEYLKPKEYRDRLAVFEVPEFLPTARIAIALSRSIVIPG